MRLPVVVLLFYRTMRGKIRNALIQFFSRCKVPAFYDVEYKG